MRYVVPVLVAVAVIGLALLAWGVPQAGDPTSRASAIEPGWPDCDPVNANALSGGLYLLDGPTCELSTLLTDPVNGAPQWDFNSRRIAYARSEAPGDIRANADIYVLDVDSGEEQQVTDTPNRVDGGPRWTRDGSLVFASVDIADIDQAGPNYDGVWPYDLVLLPPEGEARVIASGLECLDSYEVSPSGRRLAVEAGCALGFSVSVLDVETGEELASVADATAPVWAPDSDTLAFECWPEQRGHDYTAVCLMTPSGEVSTITVDYFEGLEPTGANNANINAWRPTWSQDGNTLLFRGIDSPYLYTLAADGTGDAHLIEERPDELLGFTRWYSGDVMSFDHCLSRGIAPCPDVRTISRRISTGAEQETVLTTDCGTTSHWSRDGQRMALNAPQGTACY